MPATVAIAAARNGLAGLFRRAKRRSAPTSAARRDRSHRRPRVVIAVTVDLSWNVIAQFPEYLSERGWEVHLVSSSGPRLRSHAEHANVIAHPLPMAREPSPIRDTKSLCAWIALLRDIAPDVLLAGTPKASLLALVAARLVGVPSRVYHLWGLRYESESGYRRLLLRLLERVTVWASTQVLAVSRSLGHAAVEDGLVRRDKVVTLGHGSSHGIDLTHFDADAVSPAAVARVRNELLSSEAPVVGFVGRLTPAKGLATLAAALRRLERAGQPAQLLVVGGLEDADLASFSGLTFAPVFVGEVQDVRPYYRNMDVLCLPTLREGLPNVCIEAAAMGVPVVTTDATGAVDSIAHNLTGLLVPVASDAALADALSRLLSDAATRRTFGSNGRVWVAARFERAAVWSALHEHLKSGLRSGPA
jgi:glycosyltransferase involved in cell wall biosynthesis